MTSPAYTPFIDPIQLGEWWFVLIVPVAFFIACGYKAVRATNMRRYWPQVLSFTIQIVGGVALLGLALYLVIGYAIPALAPMPGS